MATSTRAQSRSDSTARPNTRRTCPTCLAEPTETPTETYCDKCGTVLEADPIDHGPEYRHFDDASDARHYAPGNRNMVGRGLGSEVGRHDERDADTERRATWQTRAQGDKRDRNRAYATTQIHRMTAALSLPEWVSDRARRVFREVHADDVLGWDLDTVAATCLYAACREAGQGIVPSEVAEVARCEQRSIQRRLFAIADRASVEVPPPNVAQRVRVVARALPVGRDVIDSAVERVRDADVTGGTSPSAVAAAALWDASGLTQATIGEAADVTPHTIRNARRKL